MAETQALAIPQVEAAVEAALITGDLGKLTSEQRVNYYNSVCKSIGLNPLTQPFTYITLNGKLTLYARRDATDQLRKIHGVNVKLSKAERLDDVYLAVAEATDKTGRVDTSTGAVSIAGLKGDALANALMKAETKAKRRVTLSIVGLGWLDETEIETIPDARPAIAAPVSAEFTESDGNGHEKGQVAPPVAPPVAPVECKNDWIAEEGKRKYFWGRAKSMGYTQDSLHEALGVTTMREYAGSMDEALEALRVKFEGDEAKA
ncbi:MAG TPA: hypothetical protein DCP69_04240 [Candidatus Omnitrophica bacterium]|nr:hypothetical protein [Candidatus Omnitrophota bacterium]